jgi:hypothetical protein
MTNITELTLYRNDVGDALEERGWSFGSMTPPNTAGWTRDIHTVYVRLPDLPPPAELVLEIYFPGRGEFKWKPESEKKFQGCDFANLETVFYESRDTWEAAWKDMASRAGVR